MKKRNQNTEFISKAIMSPRKTRFPKGWLMLYTFQNISIAWQAEQVTHPHSWWRDEETKGRLRDTRVGETVSTSCSYAWALCVTEPAAWFEEEPRAWSMLGKCPLSQSQLSLQIVLLRNRVSKIKLPRLSLNLLCNHQALGLQSSHLSLSRR